ncbi:glycosyltransferase family 2 protein [Pseudonocardia humida]|uniref:Glycosyltransferase family 2 protein n=1 Tax=Pseudonocardia humida TaxID=2800819 RepID=A0ABT1A1L4_9PSEU|nr:glycosyltransferase family 2 protein [Pseudonocardia humida]MCO1656893.1 glycosyltransferase family 2 protein [Pseudonocardia humida]
MTTAPAVTASVVICVYTEKRWNDIVDAVASVQDQTVTPPHRLIETLVVVDHNEALLERARARFTDPGVRVLPNANKQGLSGARNTAVAETTGDIVVFLDDDASARPGWLDALLAPYADPTVAGVGGVAHPRWPTNRPRVLPGEAPYDPDATGELDWIVGCTYTGQPRKQAEVRNVMGCNMSFRREVFDRVGGFAEDIGRIGKNPLGCEETELCIRAHQAYRRAGEKIRILFEPAAVVDHRVSSDRVEWSYLRRRSWSEGLSKAAVSKMVGAGDGLSTERSYVAKVLPSAVLRELKEGRVSSAAAVVTALAFTSAGYVRGKLPGATAGVRMPGDPQAGLGPLTPPPASGTGQNIAAQSPTAANPSAEPVRVPQPDQVAPSPNTGA